MADNEVPQTGATPGSVNLYPLPHVPDWVRLLLDKDDPSPFIFCKLSDEGFTESLTWMMALAPDPATLEAIHRYLSVHFAVSETGDFDLLEMVYLDAWNYHTGGHS